MNLADTNGANECSALGAPALITPITATALREQVNTDYCKELPTFA